MTAKIATLFAAAVLITADTGSSEATVLTIPAASGALLTKGLEGNEPIAIATKRTIRRQPRKSYRRDRSVGSTINPLGEILGGIALGALGLSGGGYGSCAVDYTTPNPTRCRVSRYSGPPVEPANHPQKQHSKPKRRPGNTSGGSTYTCFNNNGTRYISTTYRLGCYFSKLDEPGHRLGDGLNQIK